MTAAPTILALDLSLTATGYCRGDEKCAYPLDPASGVHHTGHLRGQKRIADIRRRIVPMANRSDLVVIEGYSFGSQGRSVFDIAELGGVIRHDLYLRGIPYVEIPPATLKKFATGKGNVGKDAMIAAAIRRFGYGGEDNNEADAYLLWCMAREAYGSPVAKLPAIQSAVVQAIAWPRLEVAAA